MPISAQSPPQGQANEGEAPRTTGTSLGRRGWAPGGTPALGRLGGFRACSCSSPGQAWPPQQQLGRRLESQESRAQAAPAWGSVTEADGAQGRQEGRGEPRAEPAHPPHSWVGGHRDRAVPPAPSPGVLPLTGNCPLASSGLGLNLCPAAVPHSPPPARCRTTPPTDPLASTEHPQELPPPLPKANGHQLASWGQDGDCAAWLRDMVGAGAGGRGGSPSPPHTARARQCPGRQGCRCCEAVTTSHSLGCLSHFPPLRFGGQDSTAPGAGSSSLTQAWWHPRLHTLAKGLHWDGPSSAGHAGPEVPWARPPPAPSFWWEAVAVLRLLLRSLRYSFCRHLSLQTPQGPLRGGTRLLLQGPGSARPGLPGAPGISGTLGLSAVPPGRGP